MSLAKPRALQTPWGEARGGLRKGTVFGPLMDMEGDGEEEGSFYPSRLGQELRFGGPGAEGTPSLPAP